MRAASARSCGRTVSFFIRYSICGVASSDREVVDLELFGLDVIETERFSEAGQNVDRVAAMRWLEGHSESPEAASFPPTAMNAAIIRLAAPLGPPQAPPITGQCMESTEPLYC